MCHAAGCRVAKSARCAHRLETICLLMCFKIKYNENFFLLRGNHEAAPINRIYGFYDECKSYIARLLLGHRDCWHDEMNRGTIHRKLQ